MIKKEYFTGRQLQAVANKCAMHVDPLNYTLNNKIVIAGISDKRNKYKILDAEAGAEEMFRKHLDTKKVTSAPESITMKHAFPAEDELETLVRSTAYEIKGAGIAGWDIPVFIQGDAFNLDLKILVHIPNLITYNAYAFSSIVQYEKALSDFNTDILEAIFSTHLLLKKSIMPELKHVLTVDTSLDYAQAHNIFPLVQDRMSYLLDPSMPATPHLKIVQSWDYVIPWDIPNNWTLDVTNPKEYTLNKVLTNISKGSADFIASTLPLSIAYSIEFARILSKLDKRFQDIIYDYLKIGATDNFFTKHIFDLNAHEIQSEIEDIVTTENDALRFDRILNYLATNDTEIKSFQTDIAGYTLTGLPGIGLGMFLTSFNAYACNQIMIDIVLSIISEFKRLGITNKTVLKDIADRLDGFTGGGGSPGLGADSDISSDPFRETESFDLSKPTTKDIDPTTSTTGKRLSGNSKVIDELTKAAASFREDKYGFKVVNVPSNNNFAETYNKIATKSRLINLRLIRGLKKIKTYNEGSKLGGLRTGKLDMKNIYKYKTSNEIFYKNKYKIRESDLAIGVILDCSGSMQGQNVTDGKITLIVLHETLRALGINHSIITHNSEGEYQSTISKYVDFKGQGQYSINKNYSLAGIDAGGGNCDSGALYFMEKTLLHTPNKDKICIIFSDGEPTECSDSDLKLQIRAMERKGIKVIGIGIQLPSIADYYTDYANGNNLKEMLDIITKVLEEYILHKKD